MSLDSPLADVSYDEVKEFVRSLDDTEELEDVYANAMMLSECAKDEIKRRSTDGQ